jgi:PKD repeat protein
MKSIKVLFSLFAIAALLIWSGCSKDDDDALLASFVYEHTATPGEVSFINLSLNADVFEWNFGDGTSSTMTNPVHQYDENDSFIVILKAQGNAGSASVQDTVLVNNIP